MCHVTSAIRHGRHTLPDQRGQALVEFALVLPILMLLVLGVLDLGKALGYKNDQTHLANEAARQAAVNACPGCTAGALTINDWIKTQAETTELQNGMTVTIEFLPPTAAGSKNHCVGQPVKVTLGYGYSFLGFLGLGPVTLQSSSTMRLEKNWGNPTTGAYDSTTDKYTVKSGTASADAC